MPYSYIAVGALAALLLLVLLLLLLLLLVRRCRRRQPAKYDAEVFAGNVYVKEGPPHPASVRDIDEVLCFRSLLCRYLKTLTCYKVHCFKCS